MEIYLGHRIDRKLKSSLMLQEFNKTDRDLVGNYRRKP